MRLLGLLLGVGLALGLTLFVMGKVDSQTKATAKAAGVTVLPGGIVVPPPDGAAPSGGNAVHAARTVACASASLALRTAEDTYQVSNGRYADLATLVSSGTIRAPSPSLYTITSTDSYATYRLVGQQGCP